MGAITKHFYNAPLSILCSRYWNTELLTVSANSQPVYPAGCLLI